jgi:iron complex transport system substrate-binding protein
LCIGLALMAASLASNASGAVSVRDDNGNIVTLAKPAQRIVSLAPHVTELLFAAGAGARIVGTVSYSDYPEAAKTIPRIGTYSEIDPERVLAMKPDLIVVWTNGNSAREIDTLRRLGIPVFHSEPRKLEDIPDSILRMGQLLGTEVSASAAAAQLRLKLAALTRQYANRPPVRMFYQVWDKPMYTLSGAHILSEAIRLCGGTNIFAHLKATAPEVSVEGVLREDPEAIFATAEKNYAGVNIWRPYPAMAAVRADNLFTLDGDLLNRAGPRMITGTAMLCEKLELARRHRK